MENVVTYAYLNKFTIGHLKEMYRPYLIGQMHLKKKAIIDHLCLRKAEKKDTEPLVYFIFKILEKQEKSEI